VRKQRRVQQITLLIVGEGAHDKAFLQHMKSLYDHRENGQRLTIDNGDGGSPYDVINAAKRKSSHTAFDRKYVLLDDDIALSAAAIALANKEKIKIIKSSPVCLEGMLLELLSQRVTVDTTARECKNRLHPQLSGPATEPLSYQELFPKPLLDQTDKLQIVTLRQLISHS